MFHYTVKNYMRNEEWAVICYACLPRLRGAGYDVQQHDGRKDTCALCGSSSGPPTHRERGPCPLPEGHPFPAGSPALAEG